MSIAVTFEQGTGGFSPRIVRIVTTSTLAQVIVAGWYPNAAPNQLLPSDEVEIAYAQGSSGAATALFSVAISAGVVTLSLVSASQVGPSTVATVLASATPGTVRSITGAISDSVLTTSGNLVGVRGSVASVGNSGAYLYGAQGKVISTGAMTNTGGGFVAGVLGQFDMSAATVSTSGAYMAPIWADYGATFTSGTYTQCYGVAMTNSTAAILGGQIYLYGGATALMHLVDNNAGVGATYFVASGTSAGSWGNATAPTPSKVLTLSINGTLYYLPLVAQNT